MQDHVWALTEYEKEELKAGEIYCLECKKRAGAVTCLECWDTYCKECFKYTHASGNLKYHKTQAFHRAKKGWMCVKSRSVDEADYYVNGSTGITTYEKPEELMSSDEKHYYDQFRDFQGQMDGFLNQIKTLQFDLEDANYERDLMFQKSLEQGLQMQDVIARRNHKKKKKNNQDMFSAKDDGKDTINEVAKDIKPSFWGGVSSMLAEYRTAILAPAPRRRGAQRSDYIAKLLEETKEENSRKKN